MLTQHNFDQKRARLEREICEWTGRLLMARTRGSTEEKRRYSVALRCLNRRVGALAALNRREADAPVSRGMRDKRD